MATSGYDPADEDEFWILSTAVAIYSRPKSSTICSSGIAPCRSRRQLPSSLVRSMMVEGITPGDWSAVHDDRQAIAQLIAHLHRRSAFDFAVQVGRGRRDRQSGRANDGQRNFGGGHAQRDIAGIGRDLQRQLGIGLHDDGQRSGPEAARQQIEDFRHGPRQVGGLIDGFDQQRERLVPRARLDLVNAIDGMQIEGIDREAVKVSVGMPSTSPARIFSAT